MSQLTLNACYPLIPLCFLIKVDRYSKILDTGHAGNARDVAQLVLREHLGLGLVKPQIPHFAEAVELLDGLGHLRFRVGMYEHVIRKCEEVTPPHHFLQLFCSAQCFLQVDIEQHGGEYPTLHYT